MYRRKRLSVASGFTLVELLIVIVVIGILAAITLVAYNGIQAKANDSRRMSDIDSMKKALSLYKVENGSFPPANPNPGTATWERSLDPGFLSSLNSVDGNAVFSDPINNSTSWYRYKSFAPGTYNCPVSLGSFYILWVNNMQAQQSEKIVTNGCDSQTLFTLSSSPPTGSYAENDNYYVYYGFN